jgi:2-polyprenyl-6-hydroxyphenyl methylase/3-demethylubiquinone-9 3-methyltransferase
MSEARFKFGDNWRSFITTVSDDSIAQAERGLQRLFPGGELNGARFLDIGCGSGLSSLAAQRLGARSVTAIDFDPASVATTRELLTRHAPNGEVSVAVKSALDLDGSETYDVVYSWGVLHHTGAMWRAMERAASTVAPNGLFAFALYRRTPLCGFWTVEKRFYAQASPIVQRAVAAVFKIAFVAGLLAQARNPKTYIANYRSTRGMDWHHDVHDWLGGYPYESVDPGEVRAFLDTHGFDLVRSFEHPPKALGLFGSHCDEFVARRRG